MEKKNLIIFAVAIFLSLIVGVFAVYFILKNDTEEIVVGVNAKEVLLHCSTGISLKALYHGKDKNGVMTKLTLSAISNGEMVEYKMTQTLSASGAKFETKDKVFSLWEHQKTFSFDQNGSTVAFCEEGVVDTFFLDGKEIALVNDVYEKEIAPGSVARETVRYFGNEARGDINGDGKEDRVFLVTQETGGSGVFFYVVGQLGVDGTQKGTKALFIGDRIAPQTTTIEDNKVIINFADRKEGEPMTVAPSVGKTLTLLYNKDFNDFGEVVKNFEGEADIAKMTLPMKEWKWQKTVYANQEEIFPKNKDVFVATFTQEGNATFRTDCNTLHASFELDAGRISFGQIGSTKMFCAQSQEEKYKEMLSQVEKYIFTSRGELIFLLKDDGGSIIFK